MEKDDKRKETDRARDTVPKNSDTEVLGGRQGFEEDDRTAFGTVDYGAGREQDSSAVCSDHYPVSAMFSESHCGRVRSDFSSDPPT